MDARTLIASITAAVGLVFAAADAQAQQRVRDGFVEIQSSTDRGSTLVLLEGLPSTRDLRVERIGVGSWVRNEKDVGPASGTGFLPAALTGSSFMRAGTSRIVIAHFRARAANDSPVNVLVRDTFGRTHCYAEGSGRAGATCTARIDHADFASVSIGGRFDVLVDSGHRSPFPTKVTVEGFFQEIFPANPLLELQLDPVPGTAGSALLRVPMNLRMQAPGKALGELLSVKDGDTELRRITVKSEWNGSTPAASIGIFDDGPIYQPTGLLRSSSSHAAITTHRRLPFLVPANVDAVELTVSTFESDDGIQEPTGTGRDLLLELHHLPGDPSQAEVTAVPAGRRPDIIVDTETARASPSAAREVFTLRAPQLKPGRWFVVPVSKLGNPLNVSISMRFPAGQPLKPVAGHYFNPSRPGHGFYLGEAGSDWVLIWYTYQADGAPVWYYAQGPKPSDASGGSQWNSALYRNVWNGSRTRFQFVGFVQLAMTGDDRMEFAHLVDGQLGIETVQRLGSRGCSQQLANQALDVNGLWYSPQKSGYGFSAEVIGNTEFYLAYAYDGQGLPRWGTAQQSFNASTTMPLLQARGVCPTCVYAPSQRAAAGTLSRDLAASAAPDSRPGFARIGLDARWINGIAGAWNENLPVSMLSARTGCQ